MVKQIFTLTFLFSCTLINGQNCADFVTKNSDRFTQTTVMGSKDWLVLQNENSYTKRKLKFGISKIVGNEPINFEITTTTGEDVRNIKIFPDAGIYFLFDDNTSIFVSNSKDYPPNDSGDMMLSFASYINESLLKKLKQNKVIAIRLVKTGYADEQMALDFDIPSGKQSFFKDVINCMDK